MDSSSEGPEPDPPTTDPQKVGEKLDQAREILQEYLELNSGSLSRDLVHTGN